MAPLIYQFFSPSTDAIQVQDHVQVAAQLPEAIHRGAKRFDSAFWEICSCDVLEQGADEEAQPAVLLRQLISFRQGDYLLLYLEDIQKTLTLTNALLFF